jgi:hypothetical protein
MFTESDSAFWYYYDWCREMEALHEQEQEELEEEEEELEAPKGLNH